MKNIAIWGAASGLGAAMVDYYHQKGVNVIAIARNPDKNTKIAEYQLTAISCDATNSNQVDKCCQSAT
ncbi:hypothetical protein Sps_03521 [Shewanella psychrophila]|uniref:Short chain dehydrogenase n=1 Tax=Shewanella psychrophila TaxID=225848 RepID=A0A1S6HT56_9GAMM|nr:SDR family NAD(P)-dependent oxidoreductase [Shewanella psychrophila]AQS38648.1 hypothetical protein Sps_03521 [Shewanella psychrophila]